MKLSPHFSLYEMYKSREADRLGIDNEPKDKTIINNLERLCENVLEPTRTRYGISFSPNSGYRCLELNRALKSKDTSQHILGEAVDFELPSVDNYELALWLKNNIYYDQLILEFYDKDKGGDSGWVHVSLKENVNSGTILTINKLGTHIGLIK